MQQEQLTRQIGIFHTIFLVCLTLFIIFLIIDLLLFYQLKIWRVIGFLTGKTQQRAVEEMLSGEKQAGVRKGKTSGGPRKKSRKKNGGADRKRSIMTPSGQLKMPGSDEVMLSAGSDITDVLGQTESRDFARAEKKPAAEPIYFQTEKTGSGRRFVIEKEIIQIHTEEHI